MAYRVGTSEEEVAEHSLVRGLVRSARPKQWVKNLLVVAAPVLAGKIVEAPVLLATGIAFVAFVLASSGIYLINDVIDAEEDRAHPRKRHRPVAAGVVPPQVALMVAVVLLLAAPALALAATSELALVVVVYESLQLGYCLLLKNQPVFDICLIAAGFLLRAIAGGSANHDIALSQWFLLAATFGSLFMASGKRYAETRAAGDGEETRQTLGLYTPTYLRFVWTTSAGLLIMTYALWTFQLQERTESPLALISAAPFVVAVLLYSVDVDAGRAAEPENIVWSDRWLQFMGAVWVGLISLALYV